MNTAKALDAAAAGAVVLTVNNRLARSLTAAYTERQITAGREAWETPDILPWNSWLERWWRRSPEAGAAILLSGAQEQYVWEKVIADSDDAGRLLEIPPAAAAAMDAWRLVQQWALPMTGEEWERSEDAQAFLRWADAFRETCAEERWLDRARVAERMTELVRAGCVEPPRRVVIENFDELTPRQQILLDALRDAGCQVEYNVPGAAEQGAAPLVALRESKEEIAAAARWCRGLLDGGAAGPIGVVAPALEAMRATVERIFSDVLHPGAPADSPRAFNISAAPALAAYPVIQTAFLVLRLGLGKLTLAEAGSLLRSPFLFGAEREFTARARIDAGLRELGEIEVTSGRLADHSLICPLLADCMEDWRAEWRDLPREQPPSGWSRAFAALLDALGWAKGRALDSVEYQAVKAWGGLLSEFASLDACAGAMRYSEALGRLMRIAAGTPFQPETDAPAPVQILGALEASGQRFEHLWIMGLHDEAWPPAAKPNPFLPLPLQRERSLPNATPERELAFARLITRRLLASAPEAIVSYPEREGDRDLRPSPLVAGLPLAGPLPLSPAPTLLDCVKSVGGLELKVEQFPAPLPAPADWRGGTKIFQLQAACPFWAFAEFRLGAKTLHEGEFGLRALDRGILIHRVLEAVWKELRSHARLCELSPDQLGALVQESVGHAVEEYAEKRAQAFTPRFTDLERARIERLVLDWLEGEKSRAPFEVVNPEDERIVEIGGIRFRARIDRIDRLADGREVILDYKTGEVDTKKWESARPDEPQLPVYSITNNEGDLAGVFFAQVKAGKVGFKGIARGQEIVPGGKELEEEEWAARMAEWRQALEDLARDFRAGRADADPKKPGETCRRCRLTALCRARELGRYCMEPEENGD